MSLRVLTVWPCGMSRFALKIRPRFPRLGPVVPNQLSTAVFSETSLASFLCPVHPAFLPVNGKADTPSSLISYVLLVFGATSSYQSLNVRSVQFAPDDAKSSPITDDQASAYLIEHKLLRRVQYSGPDDICAALALHRA